MNPNQKVLFVQLQIASVGVLLAAFGFAWHKGWLLIFGLCILVYGLFRYVLLSRLLKSSTALTAQEAADLEGKDPFVQFGQDGYEPNDEGEYSIDEWEQRLEAHFVKAGRQSATIAKLEQMAAPSQPDSQTCPAPGIQNSNPEDSAAASITQAIRQEHPPEEPQ